MSKTSHKLITKTLAVAVDQVVGTFDATSCNGVSVQINGIAATAGSMKLQRSNDNTNWEDIPSATATLAASVAKIIEVSQFYSAHVRIMVTLSGGAGDYTFFVLGKEH